MSIFSKAIPSPFVGLQPFRETDQPYFFGREREIRIISSSLLTPKLTVLYGPSGVGKSSILQAGVMPHLRKQPETVVLYFNEWQDDGFLELLRSRSRAVIPKPSSSPRDEEMTFDEIVFEAGQRIYLLLDQFEEYLFYHADSDLAELFDTALARIVNAEDVKVQVLIGIREDGLSQFDRRFSIRIADLLANTLAVAPLTWEQARDAAEKPLNVLNDKYVKAGEERFEAEPTLIERILSEVQYGVVEVGGDVGRGMKSKSAENSHIEAPFLQLVLTRIWNQERANDSRKLHVKTLQEIGGSAKILTTYVQEIMDELGSDKQLAIAAKIFRYLVTPSGSKIAQSTEDLIAYSDAPKSDVSKLLKSLSERQEARILRRLASPERYEVYHDVLARAVLEWSSHYLLKAEQAEEKARRDEELARREHELEQTKKLAEEQRLRLELQRKNEELLKARELGGYSLQAVVGAAADDATPVEEVGQRVKAAAMDSVTFYIRKKLVAEKSSLLLRGVGVFFLIIAAVLPGESLVFVGGKDLLKMSIEFYVCLAAGAACLTIDRVLALAERAKRYSLVASELNRVVNSFNLNSAAVTTRSQLLPLIRELQSEVESIVQRETLGAPAAELSVGRIHAAPMTSPQPYEGEPPQAGPVSG